MIRFPALFTLALALVAPLGASARPASPDWPTRSLLSAQRSPQLPGVPTTAEAGLTAVAVTAWYGVYMPAATPKAVQQKVHDAVNEVIALPDTKARLEAVGAELQPMTQAQFIAFHGAESRRYGDVIRKNNIKLD